MLKPLLYISILFLVFYSCSNNGSNGTNIGNDTVKVNPPIVDLPVRHKKAVDYRKLYGQWVYISSHSNGDTALSAFMDDTVQSKNEFGYYRTEDFDTSCIWHERDDDIGSAGRFKIDSAKCGIDIYRYQTRKKDSIQTLRIIYLDKNYLLSETMYGNKKYVGFYMNIKARKYWKWAPSG